MIPSVHLNGTSKAALSEGYENAARQLSKALDALVQTAPNARDYYVQGPAAFTQVCAEHKARVNALKDVREQIVAIWEGVDAQG